MPRPENPHKRGYRGEYFGNKRAILARKPMCYKCRVRRASEVDHVVPLVNGGSNKRSNLRPICAPCNRKSGGGVRRTRKSVMVAARVQAALIKASFGGDRSAAGRYAAEQRWKNHKKKEEEQKERGAKSPVAQSIIEANESVKKAGLTVRVIKITKRDTKLSKLLQKAVERAAKIVAKTKKFAPFTQERWFFEAVNLMRHSVEFEDYGEYNYRSESPAGQFVIVVEKGNHIVGAMRYDPKIVQARGGVIRTAGSLRVAKGVGTAMFGEVIKLAAKMKVPAIKIEALSTAEEFWKAQGFRRVEGAKLKENGTYDMIMDSDTVKALAKEISS